MLKKRSFHAPIAFRSAVRLEDSGSGAAAHSEPSTPVAFTAPLTKRCSRSSCTYTPPAAAQPGLLGDALGRHAFLRGGAWPRRAARSGTGPSPRGPTAARPPRGERQFYAGEHRLGTRTLWSTTSSSASANSMASPPAGSGALIELPPSVGGGDRQRGERRREFIGRLAIGLEDLACSDSEVRTSSSIAPPTPTLPTQKPSSAARRKIPSSGAAQQPIPYPLRKRPPCGRHRRRPHHPGRRHHRRPG